MIVEFDRTRHTTTRAAAFSERPARALDKLVTADAAYREGLAEGREDAFEAVLTAAKAMHPQDAAARRHIEAVVRRAQTGSVTA